MSGSAPPDDDPAALFRAAVSGARPLRFDRVHREPPPPPPVPRQRLLDERAVLAESIAPDLLDLALEGGDEAAWAQPHLARQVLRDLRRGRWLVQSHLDLHGLNRDQARHQVVLFLNEALHHGHRCVRIVHGKGLRSPGREPVLKGLVHGWLRQRREVLAFCQARGIDGGSGAVIVLLAGT